MNLSIIIITFSIILGICLGLYLKNIALFIFLIEIFIIFIKLKKINKSSSFILIIVTIVSIIFYINTIFNNYKYENLYKNIDECKAIVEVVSLKEEKEYINKYIVKLKEISLFSNKIINKLYKNNKFIMYVSKDIELEFGDIIYISANFKKAESPKNFKGYNYERYLRQNKIYGILNIDKVEIINKNRNVFYFIQKIKQNLKDNILENYNKEVAGFLIGILLGDKSILTDDVKNDFKDSNLSHILAISGMHVSYVIFGIQFILNNFIKDIKIKRILLISFLLFFATFTGNSPSVLRACIMNILLLISKNIYRRNDFITSLLISLDIILVINPYNIENIGMWLSFLGTFGLVKFNNKNNIKNIFVESLKISFSVNLMIFPIILYSYNTISFTFFISNFFSSFIVGPIIIFGYISTIIQIFDSILKNLFVINIIYDIFVKGLIFIENILVLILFKVARVVASISFSKIYISKIPIFMFIIYYVLLFSKIFKLKIIFDFIKKFLDKIIIIIIFFIMFFIIYKVIPKSYIQIDFLDVGQGDCTFIKTTHNKYILIDGGNNKEYDYGEKVIMPYLLKHGIKSLDYVIISHFDSDHVRTDYFFY